MAQKDLNGAEGPKRPRKAKTAQKESNGAEGQSGTEGLERHRRARMAQSNLERRRRKGQNAAEGPERLQDEWHWVSMRQPVLRSAENWVGRGRSNGLDEG